MENVELMNYDKQNKSMKNFVYASTFNNDVGCNHLNTDNHSDENIKKQQE